MAKPDGTAIHQVVLSSGKKSSAISNVKGAKTTIKQTGDVQTVATLNDKNATVTTTKEGLNTIVFNTVNGMIETPSFEVDSNVTINSVDGEIETQIITPLNNKLQF